MTCSGRKILVKDSDGIQVYVRSFRNGTHALRQAFDVKSGQRVLSVALCAVSTDLACDGQGDGKIVHLLEENALPFWNSIDCRIMVSLGDEGESNQYTTHRPQDMSEKLCDRCGTRKLAVRWGSGLCRLRLFSPRQTLLAEVKLKESIDGVCTGAEQVFVVGDIRCKTLIFPGTGAGQATAYL